MMHTYDYLRQASYIWQMKGADNRSAEWMPGYAMHAWDRRSGRHNIGICSYALTCRIIFSVAARANHSTS